MPTDGDPAMVGSWFRVRSDVSDCFCIELTVWDVSLEEVDLVAPDTAGVDAGPDNLRLAIRCVVAAGSADICIGGNSTWGFDFLGSVEERVYKTR